MHRYPNGKFTVSQLPINYGFVIGQSFVSTVNPFVRFATIV